MKESTIEMLSKRVLLFWREEYLEEKAEVDNETGIVQRLS
jgi:hypothetical protein